MQLDPISVVARTQHLVLRSRLAGYEPDHLHRLVYRDRVLFEYYAHAASIVVTEDYPIHHLMMRTYPGSGVSADRTRTWMVDNEKLRRSMLASLRRDGPLRLRDLVDESLVTWQYSGWSRERNVDQMLRVLWGMGRVMVSDRRGLEKRWDLAERVIPAEVRRGRLRDVGVTRRAAELSLRGLGVGTMQHIREHFTIGRYPDLARVLAELERRRRIERVEVTGLPGTWYAHAQDLSMLERIGAGDWTPRSTLLSPFDNLIHDRKRAEQLFDLDYRMEIYVPKAKRRYGYYAMPLLHGDRFVARVDPAVDRAHGVLVVGAVTPEPGVRPNRSSGAAIAAAVRELAAWTGSEALEVTGPAPPAWRRALS